MYAAHVHAADSKLAGCNKTHTVGSGDTCDILATSYNLTVAQLQAINPGMDCKKLSMDQRLCVMPINTSAAVDIGSITVPMPPPPPLAAAAPQHATEPSRGAVDLAARGDELGSTMTHLDLVGAVLGVLLGLVALIVQVVVVVRCFRKRIARQEDNSNNTTLGFVDLQVVNL